MEFQTILAFLTLILGIPSVIVTTHPRCLDFAQLNSMSHAYLLSSSSSTGFDSAAFLPDLATGDHSYLASSGVSSVLTVILVVMALLSTYFLPALVHISTHFFKKPVTIVIPRKPVQHHSSAPDLTGTVDMMLMV